MSYILIFDYDVTSISSEYCTSTFLRYWTIVSKFFRRLSKFRLKCFPRDSALKITRNQIYWLPSLEWRNGGGGAARAQMEVFWDKTLTLSHPCWRRTCNWRHDTVALTADRYEYTSNRYPTTLNTLGNCFLILCTVGRWTAFAQAQQSHCAIL